MRNIKLLLEYDGTDYHGFQKQPGLPTIQGEVEGRLARILGEPTKLIGAGRTDAGVHASGQVANFLTENQISPEQISTALNGLLPESIAVKRATEMPLSFDARRYARSRVYRYTIFSDRHRSALRARYAHFIAEPLNLEAMKKGARFLVGEHDFRPFQASGSPVRSTARTVLALECRRSGKVVLITAEADSFLYRMVRMMVGALIGVGLGHLRPEIMGTAWQSGWEASRPACAPACGLCLIRVRY